MTNNSLDEEDWGEHWEPETNDLLYDRDFRGLIDCSNLCFWTPETLKDELSWAAGEGCFACGKATLLFRRRVSI
jgi:hypothetical protein